LSCVGMWLSRESHAKFAIPNTRQLEHGNHYVCVNVEVNIGTNRVHLRGGHWPTKSGARRRWRAADRHSSQSQSSHGRRSTVRRTSFVPTQSCCPPAMSTYAPDRSPSAMLFQLHY
jgi:hypothetical protein